MQMKKFLLLGLLAGSCAVTIAQRPTGSDSTQRPAGQLPVTGGAPRAGVRPYKEVITDKAITKKGLFTVHKVDDKWYFEIPDSVMNREIMAVTRYTRIAGGGGVYGGELANQQTIVWEKGPSNNVFLRVVTQISVADSTNEIYQAVICCSLETGT
jgi:uncharacterized protein YdeI (BOF family)